MDLYSRALRTLRAGLAGFVALVSVVLVGTPAGATDDPPPPRWTTFVVGDSITYLGAPYLRSLRPSWFIYGQGGLNVTAIPKMVDNILVLNPQPELVVIALGTNANTTWTRQKLLDAVGRLPSATKVALVTTYRNPDLFTAIYPIVEAREYFQPIYSSWMRDLAETRVNTCAVHWRPLVAQNPTLLYDGVHPTVLGRQWWAWLVSSAGTNCT